MDNIKTCTTCERELIAVLDRIYRGVDGLFYCNVHKSLESEEVIFNSSGEEIGTLTAPAEHIRKRFEAI